MKIKLGKIWGKLGNITPKRLPEIFYIENTNNGNCDGSYNSLLRYVKGWRSLADAVSNDDAKFVFDNRYCLVVRYNKKLIGQECWVILDKGNGDPLNFHGKMYLWVYDKQEHSIKKYNEYLKNKKHYSELSKPVKCLIVDSFSVKQNFSTDW